MEELSHGMDTNANESFNNTATVCLLQACPQGMCAYFYPLYLNELWSMETGITTLHIGVFFRCATDVRQLDTDVSLSRHKP